MSHLNYYETHPITLPLNGIIDRNVDIIGQYNNQATGLTSAYSTDFAAQGAKIFIKVNSLTGSGDITITGTSVDEKGIKTTSDSEIITVDTASGQRYKTNKNWVEITNIGIGTGITSINYDVGRISYMNCFNRKFEWIGYHANIYTQNNNCDLTIRVIKVKTDVNKKFSLIDLESYSIDSGNSGDQIIDNIRTGAEDRSYNPIISQIVSNDQHFEIIQFDMPQYWAISKENVINGQLEEGIILHLEGYPLDTTFSNIDFITVYFVYKIYNEL